MTTLKDCESTQLQMSDKVTKYMPVYTYCILP
jgi:hypothetical protein